MSAPQADFFSAALSAGSILTGFCGTFLSFRIQREANYYRQPALDFKSRRAKDVPINLSHFSSGFFLLIVATLTATVFGFALPLLALSGLGGIKEKIVAGGLLSALILAGGYFWIELRHYRILSNRLLNDAREWGSQVRSLVICILLAVGAFLIVVCGLANN